MTSFICEFLAPFLFANIFRTFIPFLALNSYELKDSTKNQKCKNLKFQI